MPFSRSISSQRAKRTALERAAVKIANSQAWADMESYWWMVAISFGSSETAQAA